MSKPTAETITSKLHERSDKKLRAYCEERFGDLFDMCGDHRANSIDPKGNKELGQSLVNVGSNRDREVWHGSVWGLAGETLYEMLKVKWRNQEVADFMGNLESMKDDIAHLENHVG